MVTTVKTPPLIYANSLKKKKNEFLSNFWALKVARRENGSQKSITGQEFGSKISLPDENWILPYQTRIGFSHPVMIFESPISVS